MCLPTWRPRGLSSFWICQEYQTTKFKAKTERLMPRGGKKKSPIIPLSPYVKSQLTGKDPDAGKDWGQEEKGMTEDEMVGWHHWLSGYEFEQTLGDSERQGGLACCIPWCCKDSDMSEQLNNTFCAKQGCWFQVVHGSHAES